MFRVSSPHPVWIFLLVLLAGCVSSAVTEGPETLLEAGRLERSVTSLRVRAAPSQAVADLERALRLYALSDDEDGQLRCHLKLARMGFALGEQAMAVEHLDASLLISDRLGLPAHLYQARIRKAPDGFHLALGFARTPIERAVALTYLGRVEEARALVRAHLDEVEGEADDLAFVLYTYAKQAADVASAEQALALYKAAENPVGTADALYLLARSGSRART